MNDHQLHFKARIQDFLNYHFPNDNHVFKDYMNHFYVIVGEEKNSKLVFNVNGTSIYRLTINKDHYDDIAPIFGLDNIDRSQFEILNDFLIEVNKHSSFSEFFDTINPINFDRMLGCDFHEPSNQYDINDHIGFKIKLKFDSNQYSCSVQFDWHFENTLDNTKLKGLLALCLTSKQQVRFAVGFNTQTKKANAHTTKTFSYNDFFEKNELLNLDTHLNTYLNDFFSLLIEQQNKEPFDGKDMNLKDLVNVFNMTKI